MTSIAMAPNINLTLLGQIQSASIGSGAGAVDVHVDVGVPGDGSNILTRRDASTGDAVTVGQDVLVGSA